MIIKKSHWSTGFKVFGLLLLLMMSTVGFSYRCYWYVVTPGGDIGDDNTGTTAGQTAVGYVTGSSDYGDGTYGFWHEDFNPIICFTVNPPEPSIWEIDTLDVNHTESMMLGDQFEITNCGNCYLGFSLRWIESDPLLWVAGYSVAIDRFVTRARFTGALAAPDVYDHARDYITGDATWSTPDRFGPAGYALGIEQTEYLWMQLITPLGCSSSEDYGTLNILDFYLEARANLP